MITNFCLYSVSAHSFLKKHFTSIRLQGHLLCAAVFNTQAWCVWFYVYFLMVSNTQTVLHRCVFFLTNGYFVFFCPFKVCFRNQWVQQKKSFGFFLSKMSLFTVLLHNTCQHTYCPLLYQWFIAHVPSIYCPVLCVYCLTLLCIYTTCSLWVSWCSLDLTWSFFLWVCEHAI